MNEADASALKPAEQAIQTIGPAPREPQDEARPNDIGERAQQNQDKLWQSLVSFCIYRLVILLILAGSYWGFHRFQVGGAISLVMAAAVIAAYFAVGAGMLVTAQMRMPGAPAMHLTAQVVADVIGVTLLMHASGGIKSGIGLFLLITLAAAALVSRGRMAFFHAALAALAVLLEQSWQLLYLDGAANDFVPAGLLAATFFVVAGLGYTLAKYASGAEKIAEARGIDLANLAQINELVIRDMQDGFVVVDERGVIRQHNPQSAAMVGGLQNATGLALAGAAPQLAVLLENWRRDQSRTRVFPMMRDVTTQKDYQVRFLAIGDKTPAPTVVFLEDAGRVRAQAQQMKLVALGRLTASIAHEIRNPLSSINHAAELLKEDVGRSEADARLLTIIEQNAHRLDRMVQEVLYLNRRDRAHPEPIDVAAYLEQFVRDFCGNEKIDPKVIAVELGTTRRIVFDRSHLDQVVWNLTRNACRHSQGLTGSVKINVQSVPVNASTKTNVPDMMWLSVEDDGPGVAVDAMAHLFEPFFTTDSQGTGLGLYIAQELSEVNGARIEYLANARAAANRGACFRITMNGA